MTVPIDDELAGAPPPGIAYPWDAPPAAPMPPSPDDPTAAWPAGAPPPWEAQQEVPGLDIPQSAIAPALAAAPPAAELPPLVGELGQGIHDAGSSLAGALGHQPELPPQLQTIPQQQPPQQAELGAPASMQAQPTLPLDPAGRQPGAPTQKINYDRDPLADPDDDEAQQKLDTMAQKDPEGYQRYIAKREAGNQITEADRQNQAYQDSADSADRSLKALKARNAALDATRVQTDAESTRIANTKIDQGRWWSSRSTGQKIAGYIAAIAGGLNSANTGGRNMGLEQINKAIDNDIDAQKTDLQTERAGIADRRSSLATAYAQSGDMLQAEETVRQAALKSVVNTMQTHLASLDPRGTQFIAGQQAVNQLRASMAQSMDAYTDKKAKQFDETYKLAQKDRELQETERKNQAEEAAKAAALAAKGGAGAGVGGADALAKGYTVATGFADPFTGDQIMGRRAIGGKGEDQSERKTVAAMLGTYPHVQDYWNKLAEVGAKIEYHQSFPETMWSKFKTTDAAEYDAAREALTVYLTKELGDKLTTGQLEAQQHRIPERDAILESRDPGKQIRDAQEDADRDFIRDTNLVGIDGATIVKHAQAMRAPAPIPSADADIEAAQAAVANAGTSKEKKDAQAALDAAKDRATHEAQNADADAGFVTQARAHYHPAGVRPVDGLPPDVRAEGRARNDAADTLDQYEQKFKALDKAAPKPTKAKGDNAKADEQHTQQLAMAARRVHQQRAVVEQADSSLADSLVAKFGSKNFGGLPPAVVQRVAELYKLDASKAGNDMAGQVERGKLSAALKTEVQHSAITRRHFLDTFYKAQADVGGNAADTAARKKAGG